MLVKINTTTPAFALKFAGSDGISLATLCAGRGEALKMQAEAKAIGRDAQIVPVAVTLAESEDPNSRHGGRL